MGAPGGHHCDRSQHREPRMSCVCHVYERLYHVRWQARNRPRGSRARCT
jgi:hypothetical protein